MLSVKIWPRAHSWEAGPNSCLGSLSAKLIFLFKLQTCVSTSSLLPWGSEKILVASKLTK